MPRGVPKNKAAKQPKRGVRPVKGYLTTDGRYSDDKEVAAFMEAGALARSLVRTGPGFTAAVKARQNYGVSQDTAERELARDIIKAADSLAAALRPIAKRVKSNREALAKLTADANEQSVAATQQRDLLDTDKLINKYL